MDLCYSQHLWPHKTTSKTAHPGGILADVPFALANSCQHETQPYKTTSKPSGQVVACVPLSYRSATPSLSLCNLAFLNPPAPAPAARRAPARLQAALQQTGPLHQPAERFKTLFAHFRGKKRWKVRPALHPEENFLEASRRALRLQEVQRAVPKSHHVRNPLQEHQEQNHEQNPTYKEHFLASDI